MNQKGEAQIDFTELKLRFSVDTFLQGFMLINEDKLNLKTVTLNDIELTLKKRSQTGYLIDLIIPSAFAKSDFEQLVFKTIVSLKANFKDFSCWLDKCKVDQFKHNFDLVMNEVKKKAQACEQNVNSEEVKDFAYKLRDHLEYQSNQWDLEQNLKKYFNEFGPGEVTCQKFVETAFKSELAELTKSNVFSRYLSTTSVDKYEGRTPEEQRYNAFVSQHCQPYADLRNCLLTNRRGDGAQIFNKMREQGKEVAPTKSYEVTPKSGVRKQ